MSQAPPLAAEFKHSPAFFHGARANVATARAAKWRAGDGASRGRGVGAGGAGGVASLSPVMGNGGIEAVNDE